MLFTERLKFLQAALNSGKEASFITIPVQQRSTFHMTRYTFQGLLKKTNLKTFCLFNVVLLIPNSACSKKIRRNNNKIIIIINFIQVSDTLAI